MKPSNNNRKKNNKKRNAINLKKIVMISILVIVMFAVGRQALQQTMPVPFTMQYTEFTELLKSGEVKGVAIYTGLDYFTAELNDGTKATVPNPRYDEFRKDVYESGVIVNVYTATVGDAISTIVLSLPLTLVMLALVYFLFNTVSSTARNYFTCAKQSEGVKFDEVAGMTEIKAEVQFVVDFLKTPSKYAHVGAKVPKGMLLSGPPGTGKTLLAKAIAGEANVPFISASGSDFVEMFVGLGARRVRELCDFARMNAPCVVFIDEIDAVGRKRDSIGGSNHNEGGQTLNALLQRMDGMGALSGVLFIGATNMLEHLDPALIRPGRFDRHVKISAPTNKADRIAIINVHLRGKKLAEGVTAESISSLMIGMTGADIATVINESVICSLMAGRNGELAIQDVDDALMKMILKGSNTKVIKTRDIDRVAIHEAGHAVVNLECGRMVKKVSIIPNTSGIGGITIPDMEIIDEALVRTKDDLINDVKVAYGGLVAEKIILGEYSTGNSGDIQKSSDLIRAMVTHYGMGSTLVDLTNIDNKDVAKEMRETSARILEEVTNLITSKKEDVLKLKERLLKEETIYDLESV